MLQAIKTIPLTFYSRSFYSRLAHNCRGIGMGYIWLVVLLDLLAFAAVTAPFLSSYGIHTTPLVENLPAFTYKDGKVSIDKPVPYSINYGTAENPVMVVIDTNYNMTNEKDLSLMMEQKRIVAFMTADKIMVRKRQGAELDIYDINHNKDMKPGTITHEDWLNISHKVDQFLLPGIIIAMVIGYFIYGILAVVLGAILLQLFSLILKLSLDMSHLMRLAAAARVPVAVAVLLLSLISYTPLPMTFKIAIWLVYAIFAIYAASKPQTVVL